MGNLSLKRFYIQNKNIQEKINKLEVNIQESKTLLIDLKKELQNTNILSNFLNDIVFCVYTLKSKNKPRVFVYSSTISQQFKYDVDYTKYLKIYFKYNKGKKRYKALYKLNRVPSNLDSCSKELKDFIRLQNSLKDTVDPIINKVNVIINNLDFTTFKTGDEVYLNKLWFGLKELEKSINHKKSLLKELKPKI